MSAAGSSVINRQLNDLTECSICCSSFSDPRLLPCSHTFCLQCIQVYGKNSRPGNSLSCPLCRSSFTVPKGGFNDLRKNCMAQKLVDIASQSADDLDKGDHGAEQLSQLINSRNAELAEFRACVDSNLSDFDKKLEHIREDIQKQCDQLKSAIDSSASKLYNEMRQVRESARKRNEELKRETDSVMKYLKHLSLSSSKLKDFTNIREIYAEINSKTRAVLNKTESVDISFHPSCVSTEKVGTELIGKLEITTQHVHNTGF